MLALLLTHQLWPSSGDVRWQPGFPLGEEGWEVARRAERRHADALRLLEIKLNEGLLEG